MSARKQSLAAAQPVRTAGALPFSPFEGGLTLAVKVVPGASRSNIEGVVADAAGRPQLRVRIAAPAIEGAANKALIGFVADLLEVRKSAVTIISGETARSKILRIEGDDRVLAERMSASLGA